MKIVALTGAAGYMGQKLLKQLSRENTVEKIVAIDQKEIKQEALADKISFYRLDIRDPDILKLFSDLKVETIIHMAFVLNPLRDREKMRSINIKGTLNILKAGAECKAKHIIIASSTSAFGAYPNNKAMFNEKDPLREHKGYAYAEDKYAVELAVKEFACRYKDIKVALVRPCIIYGPGVDNYLSRFLLNWPFLLQIGPNRPLMQFIHEDDAIEVFMKIINRQAEGIFHAIGEGLISTTEIASLAGIRILALPSWLAYPLINLLYFLHIPGVEAPAAMLDFIRYSWAVSDKGTREMLDHKPLYSSKEVIQVLIDSKNTRGDNNK